MKIPQNVSIFPQPLPSPTLGHWQSPGMELRKPGRMGRSSGALQPPQTLGSTLAHPGQGSLPLKTSPRRAAMQPGRRGGSWTPGSLCKPLTSSVPQFPFPTATLTAASLGQGPVQRFCRTDGEGFPMMGHPTPMPDLSSSPKTRVPCEHLLKQPPKSPLSPVLAGQQDGLGSRLWRPGSTKVLFPRTPLQPPLCLQCCRASTGTS